MTGEFLIITLFAVLFSLLIIGCVLVLLLHVSARRRRRRRQLLFDQWRPLLLELGSPNENLERLHEIAAAYPRDFLSLVLQVTSRVKGEFSQRARELVRATAMYGWIEKALNQNSEINLLLACKFISNLQLEEFRPQVAKHLAHHDPMTMFTVAHTISSFARTEDLAVIMKALEKFGSTNQDMISFVLLPFVEENPDALLDFLGTNRTLISLPLYVVTLEVLGLTRRPEAAAFLRTELDTPRSDETLIRATRALGMLNDIQATDQIAALTEHASWIVRATSVSALGALYASRFIPLMEKMMNDPNWHVRLNAANALSALGTDGLTALHRVEDTAEDPFARNMATRNIQLLNLNRSDQPL